MNSISADSLIEAIQKMKANDKIANVCVTSVEAEQSLRDQFKESGAVYKNEIYGLPTQFFGVKIRGEPEIESDCGFFFKSDKDANVFLAEIRKLKKMGLPWKAIVAFLSSEGTKRKL